MLYNINTFCSSSESSAGRNGDHHDSGSGILKTVTASTTRSIGRRFLMQVGDLLSICSVLVPLTCRNSHEYLLFLSRTPTFTGYALVHEFNITQPIRSRGTSASTTALSKTPECVPRPTGRLAGMTNVCSSRPRHRPPAPYIILRTLDRGRWLYGDGGALHG